MRSQEGAALWRLMKFISAVLLAAIVSFGWGFVSWSLLSWHQNGMNDFKDEAAVGRVIVENAGKGRGIYMLPMKPEELSFASDAERAETQARHAQAMKDGPYIYAIVRPGKTTGTMAQSLVRSALRSVFAAVLLAVLISQLTMSYPGKVSFAAAIGVFVGLVADVPDWIWFELPERDLVVNMADHFIEWTLAGSVLALFLGKELNVRNDRS